MLQICMQAMGKCNLRPLTPRLVCFVLAATPNGTQTVNRWRCESSNKLDPRPHRRNRCHPSGLDSWYTLANPMILIIPFYRIPFGRTSAASSPVLISAREASFPSSSPSRVSEVVLVHLVTIVYGSHYDTTVAVPRRVIPRNLKCCPSWVASNYEWVMIVISA